MFCGNRVPIFAVLGWVSAVFVAGVGDAQAQGVVVLSAAKRSGNDQVWQSRPADGKASWGIRGSHVPENGFMWWDNFPASGRYKVELGAIIENDGSSAFRLYIGTSADGADQKVFQGAYPYANGASKPTCDVAQKKAVYLPMGEHVVNKGDRIKFWGNSVYPCGAAHGEYCRFWEIKFTLVADTRVD